MDSTDCSKLRYDDELIEVPLDGCSHHDRSSSSPSVRCSDSREAHVHSLSPEELVEKSSPQYGPSATIKPNVFRNSCIENVDGRIIELNLPTLEDGLSSDSDFDAPQYSSKSFHIAKPNVCDCKHDVASDAIFSPSSMRKSGFADSFVSPPLVRDIWGIVKELKEALVDTRSLQIQTDESPSNTDPKFLVSGRCFRREESSSQYLTDDGHLGEHQRSDLGHIASSSNGTCEKLHVKATVEAHACEPNTRRNTAHEIRVSNGCTTSSNSDPELGTDKHTHQWIFPTQTTAVYSSSEDEEKPKMPSTRPHSQFNQPRPTLSELASRSATNCSPTASSTSTSIADSITCHSVSDGRHQDANNSGIDFKTKHEDFENDTDTDKLLQGQYQSEKPVYIPELKQEARFQATRRKHAREVSVRHPDCPGSLINGVLFNASYLGSTQLLSVRQPTRNSRMFQAQEAVNRVKAPDGEDQPNVPVELFVSTERLMILNPNLEEILIDHELRLVSYIADIGDIFVLMARRPPASSDISGESHTSKDQNTDSDRSDSTEMDHTPNTSSTHADNHIRGLSKKVFDQSRKPDTKLLCHVFESTEARLIAQSVGHAFQLAYLDFLRESGVEDLSSVKHLNYEDVLNQQEIFCDELTMFTDKQRHKQITIPKQRGELLGVVIVASGWGSLLPTALLANMNPVGPAARCGQLNIGNHIISVNEDSLVGLPINVCQQIIKKCRNMTSVRLTVVDCPPVIEVLIRRPSLHYQLGFSVQDGVICSLLRGGIAERGGIRVDHRIIEINGESVVAVPHDRIVHLLATSVGEIHIRTMPTSVFRLLTGQDAPNYI